jgi:ariadne-1
LLRHFGWNKEKLIEKYMDIPEKVNLEAGVHEDPARPKLMQLQDFTCDICFRSAEDLVVAAVTKATTSSGKGKSRANSKATPVVLPTIQTLALACGHRFCTECYGHYLEQKIKLEGESRRIQCMEEKCNLVMDEKTVQLVIEPELFER